MAIGSCKINQQGPTVLLYIDGKVVELTWEAAQLIGKGLLEKGKLAEEYAKANDIIFDQAILYRSGAPFAISKHPKILEEAKKEAISNRTIRRSNLGLCEDGVATCEEVGVPSVYHASPAKPSNDIVDGK